MASETAELTKENILTQAGVSVLSQANQNSMSALKLLG
jgi:flagellin-like hook-associated protein FlgL